ncbi:MAG TPA: gliding motility-associated C-terminal domain-containing protein [Bacteroidia bacterium]|nr:gliding motility-associated C-terminal domain-containing protein [Bacteroidia bacterium]
MKSKNYIFSILVGLICFLLPSLVSAVVTISSPRITCIAVDSVGDVTLTWDIPKDTNNTFTNYQVFSSNTKVGGYISVATILSSKQNTTTILGTNAKVLSVYFYMVTNTSGGPSSPGDTLESIFLTVNSLNSGGVANLVWNAMSVPLPATSTGWYKVYREYPKYVWTLIDSTKGLTFNDTILFCSASLSYKIEIADSSGCESVSNIPPSQIFSNQTTPGNLVLDTVSVSSTGGTSISWGKSGTKDVIGYIIYRWIRGLQVPIDTVWGINSTYFYYTPLSADSGAQTFYVAAIDSCKHTGNISPGQNTIYLTQTPDSCLHDNTLSWTKFINLHPGVGHYKLYRSFNGGPFKVLAITGEFTVGYIDNTLTVPGTYSYYVQVVDTNNPSITASSNIIHYNVYILSKAAYDYLRTATVINNISIGVQAYMDTATHASSYLLRRVPSSGGGYTDVGTVTSTSPYISFSDLVANPNQQSFSYHVIAQNGCGLPLDSTQVGETMFLTASADGSGINTLKWNDYGQWTKGVAAYNVYRNEDDGPFSLVATLPFTNAGENAYNDNISGILKGQGIFSYYIETMENPPPYPFVDTSISNIAEAYQDPRMYIPNVFDPKGRNNIFIPIGVFVELQNYDFSIYDRWGQLIFHTNDFTVGWDGTRGGKIAMEGVYAYVIVYTSSKGEYFERKGTVTLLK